ncbi:hypothetical protein AALD74_07485 [Lachnospiraceae bacterium 48-21]
MRLTDKDILLLKLAVSILTVFLMVRFLIMPGIGRYQEYTLEGKELDGTIEEMQSAIDGIPDLEQEIEERKRELTDISAKYYDLMENRQVDELLTGIALDAGLFPVSLSIGEAKGEITGPYLYGKISGGMDVPVQEGEDSSEGETGRIDGENGNTDREGRTDGYILTVNCTMVLQGSPAQVYQFIDDIAHNYPAVQIRAMHISERTYLDTEWNVVEQPEASFELAVYMHGSIGQLNN